MKAFDAKTGETIETDEYTDFATSMLLFALSYNDSTNAFWVWGHQLGAIHPSFGLNINWHTYWHPDIQDPFLSIPAYKIKKDDINRIILGALNDHDHLKNKITSRKPCAYWLNKIKFKIRGY